MPSACMLALGLMTVGGTVAAAPATGGDASAVRLCGAEDKTSAYQDLALYESNDGLSLRRVGDAALIDELSGAKSAGCAKATAANLAVEFPGQAPALLSGPVAINTNQNSFAFLDPVLCESYGHGVRTIQLTDTNGVQTALSGFTALRYDLGSRRFVPSAAATAKGPLASCHSFPWNALRSNPPQYGAAGDTGRIFGASFEITGDLLVEMIDPATGNRVGQLEVTEGTGFNYQIRVSNVGENTLAGVRIREFLPQAALTPTVDGGTWTCQRETAASCGSGSGAIGVNDISIAPGQVYTYSVQRSFSSPALSGNRSLVAAAAFVSPVHATGGAERQATDNAQPLVLTVVPNQAPVVSCTPSNLSGASSLSEDGAPVDVTCTAIDGDGDVIDSLTLVNGAGGAGFGPVDVSTLVRDGTSNSWSFTITPRANENGSVNLHLRATDEHNAQTPAAYQLPVTVAAVADAPVFSVVSTTMDVFSDGTDPDGMFNGGLLCSAAPSGFNCEAAVLDFFFGFNPGGGADEAAETVSPVLTALGTVEAQSCGITEPGQNVSTFFAKLPEILPADPQPANSAVYALRFTYRTTASGSAFCDFRFTDSGGALSAPVRVTFTMQPPPAP